MGFAAGHAHGAFKDYAGADAFLGEKKERPLDGRSTRVIRMPDGIGIRYHETWVVSYYPDGNVRVDSGGYRTQTTKARINEYTRARVYADKGLWYFGDGSLFRDGAALDEGTGLPRHPAGAAVMKAVEQAKKELDRKVKRYIVGFCESVAQAKTLPQPSAGDCMACQFREANRVVEPMGYQHYLSHLDDHYYMGSLILNALEVLGYGPAAGSLMQADAQRGRTEMLRSVLTRFFCQIKPKLMGV